MTRRFELVDKDSSKFWEIVLDKNAFTVRYGRIGTGGQTQTKSFETSKLAATEHDKLIAEKLRKGYREQTKAKPAAPARRASAVAPPVSAPPKPVAASGRPRGMALVERVLAHVQKKTLIGEPRPMVRKDLDALEVRLGCALPPSLRAWLSFDVGWLTREVGWFEGDDGIPARALGAIAEGHSAPFAASFAPFFAARLTGRGVDLDHGSDSMRLLYLGDPDEHGEYPVLFIDVDDAPTLGVEHPGFDVWLADRLGLWPSGAGNLYSKDVAATSQRLFGRKAPIEVDGESPRRVTAAVAAPAPGTHASLKLPSPLEAAGPARARALTDAQLLKSLTESVDEGKSDRVRSLLGDVTARGLEPKQLDGAILTAAGGPPEVLALLLAAGANPNAVGYYGSPLGVVAGSDGPARLASARALLAAGADPNGTSTNGGSALHAACEHSALAMARLLVEAGADVEREDSDGMTPLVRAACGGFRPELVDLLVDAGASPNGGHGHSSALHWAAEAVHQRGMVERLLARGADPDARAKYKKRTPLHLAFAAGRFGVMAALARAGANLKLRDEDGITLEGVIDKQGTDVRPIEAHYVASAEPQELTVKMRFAAFSDGDAQPGSTIASLADAIEAGAAGGDRFSPGTSRARLIRPLPRFGPVAAGYCERTLVFEVAGVAPEFLRAMAAIALRPGPEVCVALSIVGSAQGRSPLDGKALRAMLGDATAGPRAFSGEPPFSFTTSEGPACVELVTAGALGADRRQALSALLEAWIDLLPVLPDADGGGARWSTIVSKEVGKAKDKLKLELLSFDADEKLTTARFPHPHGPAIVLLRTMLRAAAARGAPLASARVSLPGANA